MFKNIILVFLGGGLGSVLRYGASYWLNQTIPYGTLLVNLLGSLLIGLFLGLYEKQILSNLHVLFFAVGFCGGFTTFSSFAAENLKFLQNQMYSAFIFYTLVSVLVGILMVFIGFKLAKL